MHESGLRVRPLSARARLPDDGESPRQQVGPDGGVVTQRTANPYTPVRFRLGPPSSTLRLAAPPQRHYGARQSRFSSVGRAHHS